MIRFKDTTDSISSYKHSTDSPGCELLIEICKILTLDNCNKQGIMYFYI